MTCREFKEWLLEREFSETRQEEAARQHLRFCSACRKLYILDEQLEGMIRQEMTAEAVPPRLSHKIKRGLAVSGRSQVLPRRSLFVAAWAAVALVAIFILFPLAPDHGEKGFQSLDQLSHLVVLDHQHEKVMSFKASEITDVPGWFVDKIGYRFVMPNLPIKQMVLLGGRKCTLGRCVAVHLQYRQGDKLASLFVLPEGDIRFTMLPGRKYLVKLNHTTVEFWKADQQVYALVG